MKKLFAFMLLLLGAVQGIYAQEPYAVLSDYNTTLTFYYDNNKEAKGGMDVGPFVFVDPGWYGQRQNIRTVVFDKTFAGCNTITSTTRWFDGCTRLRTINGIGNLNTSNVTDMTSMFRDCMNLESLDVSNFNTANVTSMSGMFSWCRYLKSLDVSNFNTANVTDMVEMFNACLSLTSLDVSKFNTQNVTNMRGMFDGCSSLTSLDVSNFNTTGVTSMQAMFANCASLTSLDVSNFKTANVTNMCAMFTDCSSLTSLDVSSFYTPGVTDMSYMFDGCSNLTSLDLRHFETDNAISMDRMFYNCERLTTIYSEEAWSCASSANMFSGCKSLSGAIIFNNNITDIAGASPTGGYFTATGEAILRPYAVLSDDKTKLTFYYDTNKKSRNGMGIGPFTRDLKNHQFEVNSGWYEQRNNITTVSFDKSFANCTDLASTAYWFYDCGLLTTINGIENLNTANVTYMNSMFCGCKGLTSLDVSNFNTANVTDMSNIFDRCSSLTSLDVSNFNTGNVRFMNRMFAGCSSLTSLDVSNFNTANVRTMGEMFEWCYKLTSLDVSKFNTENVEHMAFMFWDCFGLKSLDVRNFNTANVQLMSGMFEGCFYLTTIYSNDSWNCEQSERMFGGCTSLVGAISYDSEKTDVTYANPTTGYFTSKDDGNSEEEGNPDDEDTLCPYAVLSEDNTTLAFYYDKNKKKKGGMDIGPFTFEFDSGWYEHRKNITTVIFDESFADCTSISSTAYWFYECENLSSITGIEKLNTANVTNMRCMFEGCSCLTSLNVSNFNTQNVTNMSGMFDGCSSLTSLDVNSFNTENVTAMNSMFLDCRSLTTIYCEKAWSCDDADAMFSGCTSLDGAIDYDGQKTNAAYANPYNGYFYSPNIVIVRPYAVLSENNTTLTFYYDKSKKSNGGMGVGPFTSDAICDPFDHIVVNSGWYKQRENITKVVFDKSFAEYTGLSSTAHWFFEFSKLTTINGIENLNTANVTDMSSMFCSCSSLTSLDVSNFNTQNVTDMSNMFAGCSGLTSLDLSNFNTENVTEMRFMFNGCSSLTNIYCNDAWNCEYSYDLFGYCISLVGAINYDESKTDVTYANPTTGYFTYKRLTPMEDQEELNFAENGSLNETTKLNGKVIDNVYFNVAPGNGSFDADEKCVVVNKAMTDEEIETVFGSDLFSDEVKSTFAGMVIEVPAGKGKVNVEAQTTGGMTLKVKIGAAAPVEMELEGKLKMKFPYNVTEPTLVYIYAGEVSAGARRVNATRGEQPGLRIYGISVESEKIVKGDANGDGFINDADVLTVKDYIMGNKPENFVFKGADANEDEKINAADIVIILNKKE